MAALAAAADEQRWDDVHELLMRATADHDDPPPQLLNDVTHRLRDQDLAGLQPRPLVALRLLAAGEIDAAWAVLQDNAVGNIDEDFHANTSAGARRTAWRLPLQTCVDPPSVFAWLPGFRDPRYDAPESAYDITDLVTVRARLDELRWDGDVLELAGSAYLRHLPASSDDVVEVELVHADGGPPVVIGAQRVRRPDLVRGTGEQLTRLVWAGWSARIPMRELSRAGLWKPSLRVGADGFVRTHRLGPQRGDTVRGGDDVRAGRRRARTRIAADGWLDLLLVDPLIVRAPRQVLHRIANRAGGR